MGLPYLFSGYLVVLPKLVPWPCPLIATARPLQLTFHSGSRYRFRYQNLGAIVSQMAISAKKLASG
jgi:hypothetical protein